jgi:hypothetical protein
LLQRERSALYTPGMYLGFLGEVEYPNNGIRLTSGDAVLLYSDGATEIDTPDGLLGNACLGEFPRLARMTSPCKRPSNESGRAYPSVQPRIVTPRFFEDDVTLIVVSLKAGAS